MPLSRAGWSAREEAAEAAKVRSGIGLLGPASESGSLRQGAADQARGDRLRMSFMLAILGRPPSEGARVAYALALARNGSSAVSLRPGRVACDVPLGFAGVGGDNWRALP